MDRIQIKDLAKQQIQGNIGILFVCSLIAGAIIGLAQLIPVAGALACAIFLIPAFTLSLVTIYLNLAKGKKPEAGDVFTGFYDFWSAFKVSFLVGLFTYLWSLLFIIPGIIKAYSYSMSMFILAENKEMSALEVIAKSKAMTDGKKMDLFVLSLSFIGWALLCAVTFGLAYIWVGPYMSATYVNAYNLLKGEEPEVIEAEVV